MSNNLDKNSLKLTGEKHIVHSETGLLTTTNKASDQVHSSSGHEARKADAIARRNIESHIMFKHLGKPVQRVLKRVEKATISDKTMNQLTKVTVKTLAKVIEMLDLQEDPDRIFAWLHRQAKLAAGEKVTIRRNIAVKAEGDPIGFYKALEAKNLELMAKIKAEQDLRDAARKKNAADRLRRQADNKALKDEDAARIARAGIEINTVAALGKQDHADIAGAFNRAAQRSAADNTMSNADDEWWKQERFRKDFEKKGKKGTDWCAAIEGGRERAPESEMLARAEWYRSQVWWRTAKYRSDYLKGAGTEWWKEETYINDWQTNKEKGKMWLAVDEAAGFNSKGERRPAARTEQSRRVLWYQSNGPRGIVKLWAAAAEGTKDRCTLEEKMERIDFYKNGSWWRTTTKKHPNDAMLDAVRFNGTAAQDSEWWKQEMYCQDYENNGKLWQAVNEQQATENASSSSLVLATGDQLARRREYYDISWWKRDSFVRDYMEGGADWKKIDPTSDKLAKESEIALREDWYASEHERKWWTELCFMQDYQRHGKQGKRWTAAYKEAGWASLGESKRASAKDLDEREKYYKANWWKSDACTRDFQENKDEGTLWKQINATDDNEWWKDEDCIGSFNAWKRGSTEEFWRHRSFIEDYLQNGQDGKKWKSASAADAAGGTGAKASADELQQREQAYESRWWKAPTYAADFEAYGNNSTRWTSDSHLGRAEVGSGGANKSGMTELTKRRFYYQPPATQPTFDACFEADVNPVPIGWVDPKTAHARREKIEKNWWKSPEVINARKEKGDAAVAFFAATPAAATTGSGKDYPVDRVELAARETYVKNGKDDRLWHEKGAYFRENAANGEGLFWRNAEYITDYLGDGKKWKNANAWDAKSQASDEECKSREAWYEKNFWRAPEYQKDFETNGTRGTLWTHSDPNGKGLSVSENERKARAAYYTMGQSWQQEEQSDAFKSKHCSRAELAERLAWFEKNWWKNHDVRADWEANGKSGQLVNAKTLEAINAGLHLNDPSHKVSAAELEERERYFAEENQWWQQPAAVDDFLKYGSEGSVWTARNLRESRSCLGQERPALNDEIQRRKKWLKKNFWRAPECIESFTKGGSSWRESSLDDGTSCDTDEVSRREAWMKKRKFASPAEIARRKVWLKRTATDEEKIMRRDWILRQAAEVKMITVDELPDALASLNDGQPPTEVQLTAIRDAVRKRRAIRGNRNSDETVITQDEFVQAVADTNFYTPLTDAERKRLEQDTIDAMNVEEMAKAEEEAAYLAMEAEEEMSKAGSSWRDRREAEEEEEAFLRLQEEEEEREHAKKARSTNEDDEEVDHVTYKEYMDKYGDGRRMTKEQEEDAEAMIHEMHLEDQKRIRQQRIKKKLFQKETATLMVDDHTEVDDGVKKRRTLKTQPKWEAPEYEEDEEQYDVSEREVSKGFSAGGATRTLKKPVTEVVKESHNEGSKKRVMKKRTPTPEPEEIEVSASDAGRKKRVMKKKTPTPTPEPEPEVVELEGAGSNKRTMGSKKRVIKKKTPTPTPTPEPEPEEMSGSGGAKKMLGGKKRVIKKKTPTPTPTPEPEPEDMSGGGGAKKMLGGGKRKIVKKEPEPSSSSSEEEPELEDFGGKKRTLGGAKKLIPKKPEPVSESESEEEEEEESDEEEEEESEIQFENKGKLPPWRLPLPDVAQQRWFKNYFTVLKHDEDTGFFKRQKKRVWVVDHFTSTFYCLREDGSIKCEHPASKLLQLERHISEPDRLRLMFLDMDDSYELVFPNTELRERFYETAQASRHSVRVYAPDLTDPRVSVETSATIIDGLEKLTVYVDAPDQKNKVVNRELTGECKINASKLLTEPISFWCGTINLGGKKPPKKKNKAEVEQMFHWIPQNKYDMYCVGVQECTYRKSDEDWYDYLQFLLGENYILAGCMAIYDVLVAVFAKKKHMLKIVNAEGSFKTTAHKRVVGHKAISGCSIKFLETSIGIIVSHLPARIERSDMRKTCMEEFLGGLQLAIRDSDTTNQFHHCILMGDLNFRTEIDGSKATKLIKEESFDKLLQHDQLTKLMQKENFLNAFEEAEITFAPTYRMKIGKKGEYNAEKGQAPSYCNRILTRSMTNTWIDQSGYYSHPEVTFCEQQPVSATFVIRCVRSSISWSVIKDCPMPNFKFTEVKVDSYMGEAMKKPQLMIASTVFAPSKLLNAQKNDTKTPSWNKFPDFHSVNQDQTYLETCNILLIVRDESDKKRPEKHHKGTAYIPLYGLVLDQQDEEHFFECDLINMGQIYGTVSGKFKWVGVEQDKKIKQFRDFEGRTRDNNNPEYNYYNKEF